MKTTLFVFTNLLLVSAAAYAVDEKPAANIDSTAAFSRLKNLAGEWEADSNMGKMHVSYTLIAGGTALVERARSEKMPEMLTVYYMDGKRLLLTHFCMAGNQPRMEARSYNPSTAELQFRFLDSTNLATAAAGHMHNATFRFEDDQHLVSDWQFYENGRLKMSEGFQLTRVR